MWFIRFEQALVSLILPFLIALVLQGIPRVYLFTRAGSAELLAGYEADVFKMFYTGLLFDIRTATYAYAFSLFIAALLAVREKTFKIFKRAYPSWAAFLTVFFAFSSVLTVFYFNTYNRAVDVFIFGLIDDDTLAILKTIWFDYPVINTTLLLVVFAAAFYKLYVFWQRRTVNLTVQPPAVIGIIGVLLLAAVIFVGARGSAGLFPLRQNNAQISELSLLNSLTPNSIMAFDWALKQYRKQKKGFGYVEGFLEEAEEAVEEFFGEAASDLLVFSAVTRPIAPAAKEKPPHVVMLIMESMGSHMLNFDREDRDLFGELRKHWEEDYVFRRFIAEGSGTLDSLTRILFASPTDSISQSNLQGFDFAGNMLKPYLASGYKVVFVTSGSGSWRNLNNFLPKQGVSEFVEQHSLQRLFPEAKATAWGIADEYMLKYIENRLSEAEEAGEHLVILALSTTFHPPYKYPAHFIPSSIPLSPEELKRLSKLAGSEKEIINIFNTFKYVNNALGRFLTDIKESGLGEHTVIAVTGDHNIRGIGYPDPKEAALSNAVPFYLYIPAEYRGYAHFDSLTPGSHKDIWETVYNITLPGTPYYSLGCDLLAEVKDKPFCFGYFPGIGIVYDADGAYLYEADAFMEWDGELTLSAPREMTEAESDRYGRYMLMDKILAWHFFFQIRQGETK
jgi:phosphoglycerol transferase MdoB-like AlkP superfamily enzyme